MLPLTIAFVRRAIRLTCIVIVANVLSRPLAAQTTDAAILGTARDSTGAPLADVSIEVRNTSTGFIARAATNTSGRFAFLQLPLGGPYTVTARRIGYTPSQDTGISLGLGDRVDVAFVLTPSVLELEELIATSDSLDERAGR